MVSRNLQTDMKVVVLEAGRAGCAKALSEMFGCLGNSKRAMVAGVRAV